MKKIRIVSIPPGFAPEAIRRQWVGVTIPLATDEEINEDPPSDMGIGSSNQDGFLVLRAKAIDALRAAGGIAGAEFWERIPGRYLKFKKEVCEEVAG